MDIKTSPVIVNPVQEHHSTIIWLHGLGADGHDFSPVVPSLKLLNTKFIFPHAKHRPIGINQGAIMRGWYDIPSLDFHHNQDEAGILESSLAIQKLIKQEIDVGIPAEKIFLIGFSQGGAIALFAGLSFDHKLGGVLALSTYLPIQEKFKKEKTEASLKTPVLFCHGREDSLLPMFLAERSAEILKNMGYQVTWKDYPMAHSVCPEELIDIREYIKADENI